MYHNDESMFPEGFEDDAVAFDSEDEYIAVQGEHDGPPIVSPEKLQELRGTGSAGRSREVVSDGCDSTCDAAR